MNLYNEEYVNHVESVGDLGLEYTMHCIGTYKEYI
jgi:hypothetical protein